MFYNIYQGGGGLGQLRPAGIHRRHQDGPAAAQLVERGKLGGVFSAGNRDAPTTSRSRVAFPDTNKEGKADFGSSIRISFIGANSTRSQSERGLRPLRLRATFPQRVLFSSSFSRTHHHPLTTSHGLRGPQTHGARLNNRVSAHRKRAPEIVDERLALHGINQAMLRNLAGPRPARRAQRTHWRRMFGAQVNTNPSHRCPSHVRLSPALVSASPRVPARPFAWGCGLSGLRPTPWRRRRRSQRPPKSWAR